jgi:hypothetical protein
MSTKIVFFVILASSLVLSCVEESPKVVIPTPQKAAYGADSLQLSQEVYYDKVLGALVGSAIGDAMGASTEMWARKDIQLKYGYITGLTPAVRERSPEGTWSNNLLAGATTDDTRWKYLTVKYLSENQGKLNGENFSKFIVDYYQTVTRSLSDKDLLTDPDALDNNIEKIDWIKEWARVALAQQKNNNAYQQALNRFYGGEMSCAGQLYTPMFGLISKTAEGAYDLAYDHAIFDIGYAKDISALVSAMTQMALRTQNIDSILNTVTFVDPYGYQDSRLVRRIPYSVADASIKKVLAIQDMAITDSLLTKTELTYRMPKGFPGNQEDWIRQEMIYQFLEDNEMAIPFHAGEIWQILVTAIEFGEGDFEKTLMFIANYGRDNDTVGAVAGMIMGAKEGYKKLPAPWKETILRVNKENMGIDLEAMAREMTSLDKE